MTAYDLTMPTLSSDLLIVPADQQSTLTIRAKALAFADPRSRQLLEQLDEWAPLPGPVVLSGEWGTGRELLARRLHERSGRSGLFSSLNCASLSRRHGAAELFGYVPRAYAGTSGSRLGWFGTAHEGSLYLDEIADLPGALQEELVEVLLDGSILRLGSSLRTAVDVRLIAGSSVDLAQAVQAGNFSARLWALLAPGLVAVPPLRERPADLLPLARYFLQQHADRLDRRAPELTTQDQAALIAYPWPGNIRELEQVLHTALLTASTSGLQLGKLLPLSMVPR
ncbi:sigma 54-interacting transcriptional regulator [Pseudomonas sp. MS15a(2019)]|uniref:sigma-54-dependent transcriptional regulator n=1 Tax=Pseudomonas sp. MS15a(2019) TaxID=2579938 RepID=UPI00156546CC|nr:sigma 54-interacting transcriptional regulator [Pseudomonas sp. MS15a(2019)]NRH40678.1 sigma-54-dependent Fis family transcriptional regulator [Pseudomonas sp. MS15a(2019)]